jgi:hypothetical protein
MNVIALVTAKAGVVVTLGDLEKTLSETGAGNELNNTMGYGV